MGAVTGDGIATVEMTMLTGIELDLAVVVKSGGNATVGLDRFDNGHVPIGDAERFTGRGELDTVTYGELPFDLLVDADACKAAGIVGRKLSVRFSTVSWFADGLIATTDA